MYVYERTLHSLMSTTKEDNLWECYDAYADFDDD